jgi:hypothetical protein
MTRGAFAALVLGVAAIGFGATWFVSAGASGAQGPQVQQPGPSSSLDRALAGQLQCVRPNVAARTCRSLVAYARQPDGAIVSTGSVLLAESPVIVMRTTDHATIKAGRLCAVTERKDFAAEEFTINGEPASRGLTARLRQVVLVAMRRYIGREICELDVPQGGSFMATNFVDGALDPGVTAESFIWVSPSDGYTVAP